jgi:hypothetical protein
VLTPTDYKTRVTSLSKAVETLRKTLLAVQLSGFILEISHATAFRFRRDGDWTNPSLTALDDTLLAQAFLILFLGGGPGGTDNRMLLYGPFPGHPANDLSVANGILIDWNLLEQFVANIAGVAFGQSKPRSLGVWKNRYFPGNRMSIRVPHP